MFKKRGIHESFLIVLVVIFTLLFLSFVVAESNTEIRIHYISPDNNSFYGPLTGEPSFNFDVNGTNATYDGQLYLDGSTEGGPIVGIVNGTTETEVPLSQGIGVLGDGFYVYYFKVTNGSAGNYSATNRTFTVDNTEPLIQWGSLTSFPDEAYINTNSVFLEVTYTETNRANLTFTAFDPLVGLLNTTVISDYNTFTFNFSSMNLEGPLTDANYSFNATIWDNATNSNVTTNRLFIMDQTLPQIDYQASTTVANNSNVSTAYAFFNLTITEQNLGNMTFDLSLTDYTSTNSTVVSEWSTPYVNFTSLTGGSALPDGNYTFNATVLDRASNQKIIAVRTFFYDPTLPVVVYSHGSAVAGTTGTNSTSIFVNVSVTESNLINLTFNFRNESGAINTTVISDEIGDSNLSYINYTSLSEGLALPEGNYTFNVTGTDRMGNQNVSINGNIIIDQTFPNIDLHASSVANNTNLTNDGVFVRVNLTEQNLANISFVLANSSFVNETWITDTNVTSVNFTGLGDGYYKFNVTVTDVANQVNFTETRNITLDTTAPDAISVSASPSTLNGGESVSISCGATDNLGGDIAYVLDVQPPSGSYSTLTTSGSGTYSDTATVAGTYNVRCTVTDVYGNTAAEITSFVVSISSGSSSSGSSGGSSSSGVSYAPEVEDEEEVEEVEEVVEEITGAVVLEEESSWEETGVLEYSSSTVGEVFEMTFTTSEGLEEEHTITLNEVNVEEQYIVLTFASEPQELTIYVGESRNIDIDLDGSEDFEVALNGINEDGTADLTFTKLESWLDNESAPDNTYWWVGLVLALGIIAGIAWFVIAKKK
ncbi:MAG: hypothetical protein ISS01_02990 [Nanoarchaeota archaeon]|nr:hypothetical protein [Nanoarchaeota archaeon]